MNERSQKICPTCGHSIDYPTENEGEISTCPQCKNPVWLSRLPAETRVSSPSMPPAAIGGAPVRPGLRSLGLAYFVLTIFVLIMGYEIYRLKLEVSSLHQLRPPEPAEVEHLPANELQGAGNAMGNREIMTVERLNARLDQVAGEIKTIASKLDKSVAELLQGVGDSQVQIDTLTASIEAIVDQLSELELSRSEMESAFENLMIGYEQLQQELVARDRTLP